MSAWPPRDETAAWRWVILMGQGKIKSTMSNPLTAPTRTAEQIEAAVDAELAALKVEVMHAIAKHGPMASPHEGYAILIEEADELWECVKRDQGTWSGAQREARHIAAMGVRYNLDLTYPA